MAFIINPYVFGGGVVAPSSAEMWWIEILSSDQPESLSGGGDKTVVEMRWMTSAGAGAQPGTGTAFSAGGVGGFVAANAFDANASTYFYATSVEPDLGFDFDSAQSITHLSITVRNDGFHFQGPRAVRVYNSTDGGVTPNFVRYIVFATWTSGQTQVVDIWNDGYASENLSSLDEVGGHRYWAFEVTGDSYQGFYPCYQTELLFRKSGSNIATAYHRVRMTGLGSFDIGRPFDGTTGDNYFHMSAAGYVIVDFGYKRAIDQVGVTHRTFADGVQGLQTYDIHYADSFSTSTWDIAEMTLFASINDTGGANPPGAGATVLFSVP
jgi:hypothetical protein